MEKIIQTHNLNFSYQTENDKALPILHDINLDIMQGEFVSILGHNGSGKSTLAKHFNAILIPESGDVLVAGMDTSDESNHFNIRKTVGMVFQNPDNQIVSAVVEEDVAFALENLGIEPAEIRSRVDDALKTVNMYEYRQHSPHQLSGGQKQRVAIAGIIAMRPQCIVLDEATAMLDPAGRREVLETIRKINRDYGITILLITHYMDEAAQTDRVIVMNKGSIILDDIPKKIFSQVKLLKSIGLDVPQVTELAYELGQAGICIKNDIISEDECVDELMKLIIKDENMQS